MISRVKSPASSMKETADNIVAGDSSAATRDALDARVMRTMVAAVSLAVMISIPVAPWRITSGLLLGGLLSLLNHYWMRSSIAAAFDTALGRGNKPRIGLVNYVLRYFVVVGVVFAAYQLNIISLPATIAGLCSFVVALFFEAFREVYLAIIHREEN
jgi:ATP synthase I subunit